MFLNPYRSHEEMPLKNYYRYAVPAAGKDELRPEVQFLRAPTNKVLTMAMEVPDAWLVEAVEAVHDLDNINLAAIGDAREVRPRAHDRRFPRACWRGQLLRRTHFAFGFLR